MEQLISNIPQIFILLIVILALWEGVWKGIALWKAGRNNQLVWFICILIFNTIGILPILYIFLFQEKKIQNLKNREKK